VINIILIIMFYTLLISCPSDIAEICKKLNITTGQVSNNQTIKDSKFLSSVNSGIPVITVRWLDESIRVRMLLSSFFLIIYL
jgi:hypothetical protein